MLSLTLIFRNFHLAARGADRWRQRGARVGSACRNGEGGATRADITTTAGGLPRDRWFESGFLQQRVCEPSVPQRWSPSACLIGRPRLVSIGGTSIANRGTDPRSSERRGLSMKRRTGYMRLLTICASRTSSRARSRSRSSAKRFIARELSAPPAFRYPKSEQ